MRTTAITRGHCQQMLASVYLTLDKPPSLPYLSLRTHHPGTYPPTHLNDPHATRPEKKEKGNEPLLENWGNSGKLNKTWVGLLY